MFMESMQTMNQSGTFKHYLLHCNSHLQKRLMKIVRLPASPSESSPVQTPDSLTFSVHLATPKQPRKRITNSIRFLYSSPERRVRRKQSVPLGRDGSQDPNFGDEIKGHFGVFVLTRGEEDRSYHHSSRGDENVQICCQALFCCVSSFARLHRWQDAYSSRCHLVSGVFCCSDQRNPLTGFLLVPG